MMMKLLTSAAVLVTFAGSPGARQQAAAPDWQTMLALKGPAVVRCADGLLAFGTDAATLSGSTITLKKNAVVARMGGQFADHPDKATLAELVLIGMESVATYTGPGKLTTGDANVEVTRLKQPATCDVAEVVTAPFPVEYDKPVSLRQMNIGGRPVAILNLRYLKNQPKRTAQTCVIAAPSAAGINQPFAPELHAAFMEDLTKKQQKFFKQVVHGVAGSASDAYELQLRLLGAAFMSSEGDVAIVSFRVLDRASGKTVTYGRGFRAIGTKQEKDIRDFANIVVCL